MTEWSGDDGGADHAGSAREPLVAALSATGKADRVAVRHLYRATSSRLFGICLAVCGDRSTAEETLQDVYLTIWRRAGSYDPDGSSPIVWMMMIARERAIDRRRPRGLPREGNAVATPAIVDDRVFTDRSRHGPERCLDRLTANERDAIRTAFLYGVTYTELAAQFEVSLATMKRRVRSGLRELKACLGDGVGR